MAKGYVVEQRSTNGKLVFRDSRTGQFSDVKIMSKDTFDRASRSANGVIRNLSASQHVERRK